MLRAEAFLSNGMSRDLGLLFLVAAAVAVAQEQPSEKIASPFPESSPNKVYVRRFSLGLSVNLLAIDPFRNESQNQILEGPPRTEYQAKTTPGVNIGGFGGRIQFALTGRFALAIDGALHTVKYTTAIDQYVGTDNPDTTQDERKRSRIDETTSARLLDVPVLVRYYLKDRHEEGNRWFFEGGPSWRLARRATTQKTTKVDDKETIDNTPATHRASTPGFTMGVGMQLIDDLGIRVVPEFRYTRWLDPSFDSLSARSRQNQAEFILSLTF